MGRVRALYPWHSWLGVITGLLIFVLCVSGAVSVFKDELAAWVEASVQPAGARPDVDQAWQLFAAAVGDPAAIRRLELPAAGRGYRLRTTDGRRFRLDALGQARSEPESHRLDDFLVNYHTRFFLGHGGRWFIGTVGLCLLASVITGVLVHRRLLKALFVQRWGHSPRLAQSDAHKSIGVWGLPFHLIIALTGFWLGLHDVLIPEPAGPKSAAYSVPPADRADFWTDLPDSATPRPSELIAYTQKRIPGFEPLFLDFRGSARAAERVEVRGNLPGRLVRRHEAGAVFQRAGEWTVSLADPARMAPLRRADLVMAPLHFGDYGGGVLRWLYALLGMAAAGLALTGTLMWLSRRSGDSAAVYTRAVVLVAGGCVVATAALPLLALLAAAGVGPAFGGSMRLSAMFSEDVAPALPAFLLLWILSGGLLLRFRRAIMAVAVVLVSAGLIWVALPLIAWGVRVALEVPAAEALPGVAGGLAGCGAALLLSGCWLYRAAQRTSHTRMERSAGRTWLPS